MVQLFSFLLHYARPLWRWYFGGLVTLALTTYITLKIPELVKVIVNSFSPKMDQESLLSLALLVILLGVLQMLTRAVSRIFMFWPGRKIEAQVKEDLFSRLIYLPYQFYLSHGLGDVVSRVANDVTHLRVMVAFGTLQFLNVLFLLGFVLQKMLVIHWQLTVLCLLPMGLMVLVTRFLVPRMHSYSKYNQEALGELTNSVTEAYSNVYTIQANAAQSGFLHKIKDRTHQVYDSSIKLIAVRTFLFPLMSCFTGVSKLVILLYGGYEVLHQNFTVGDILAFSIYIGVLVFPLTAIGILVSVYQRALTAMDRANEILNEEEERTGDHLQEVADEQMPLLSVRGLSYAFESGEEVLKDVSFDVQRGEKIAIWGRIGSGKTTLFHLITRLYEPPEGALFWQGQDVTQVDIHSYRKNISYALQTAYVFSDSVEKNISFGLPDESSEAIFAAAHKAAIFEDIQKFPEQWETQVGEKGVRLSGGQKQRLSLARTLLRKSPLILLDDVLSAVDQNTEQKLIESIFSQEQTLLVSSHRPSVLQKVDRIFVFSEGSLLASGSYGEMRERFPEMMLNFQEGK